MRKTREKPMVDEKSFEKVSEDKKPQLEQEWRKARLVASSVLYPYAPAIDSLVPIMDDRIGFKKHNKKTNTVTFEPSMATDKFYRCYVNPKFVETLLEQAKAVSPSNRCKMCGATSHHEYSYLAGLIAHEAMHPLEGHADRAHDLGIKKEDANLANYTQDMEINDGLMQVFAMLAKEHGNKFPVMCLPPGGAHPNQQNLKEDDIFESYFYKLKEMQPPQGGQGNQGNQNSKGQKGQKQQGGKSQGDPQNGDQDGDGEGEGDCEHDHDGQPHYGCGSGAHGQEQEWDAGDPNESGVEGVLEADQDYIQKECAKGVQEAAKRGNMPAGMVRWADQVLAPPKYNWRKEFRKMVRAYITTKYGQDEFTYRKFARDCAASNYDIIQPSTFTPEPTVGVVLDTSGSMGYGPGSPLYDAVQEVLGICNSLGVALDVLDVDAHAKEEHIQRVTKGKKLRLQGGGGTDMRVGFQVFQKRKKGRKPDILIVLTDGETPWPDSKPREFRTIIGLVGPRINSEIRNGCPAWSKTIVVGEKDIK